MAPLVHRARKATPQTGWRRRLHTSVQRALTPNHCGIRAVVVLAVLTPLLLDFTRLTCYTCIIVTCQRASDAHGRKSQA